MTASRTYLQTSSDTVDRTVYTFTSRSLGTAAADRYIVVCAATRAAGTTPFSITEISVGGVVADIIIDEEVVSGASNASAIAIAHIPTGTSGTIVITLSRGGVRLGMVTYALYGINPVAYDTDFDIGSDPANTNIDVPSNGVVIGFNSSYVTSSSNSWTGLDVDATALVEGFLAITSASNEFITSEIARSVICDFSSVSATDRISLIAAWGPVNGVIQQRFRRQQLQYRCGL